MVVLSTYLSSEVMCVHGGGGGGGGVVYGPDIQPRPVVLRTQWAADWRMSACC
jgi:hypothetical protein